MSFLDISRARSLRMSFGTAEALSEAVRNKIAQSEAEDATIIEETDDVGASVASTATGDDSTLLNTTTPCPSPLKKAGFLSKATFSWVSSMVGEFTHQTNLLYCTSVVSNTRKQYR